MDSPHPPAPAELSHEQRIALLKAKERARPIRKAIGAAKADAAISVFLAVCCLACGLFDYTNFFWGALLAVAAFNGVRGARRLAQYDPTAAILLAKNQIFLAVVIVVYAAVSLYIALHQTADAVPAEYADLMKDMGPALDTTFLSKAVYISVMIGTVLVQGRMCFYYYTRSRQIRVYLEDTPKWVVEMQRVA